MAHSFEQNNRFFGVGAFAGILVLLLSLASCSMRSVEGGEEGVMIKKPWLFGNEGVIKEPLPTGAHLLAWTTDLVRYDVRPNRFDEPFKNLVTSDRTPVDFRASVAIAVEKGKAPVVHQDFGPNWYVNKVQRQFQALVRDFARSQKMTDLTTNTTVTAQGQMLITAQLRKHVADIHLPVVIDEVLIGAVVPPDEVLKETASTAAQEQRKLTEDNRQRAEVARKEAETSKADADRAYAQKFGMTPDQYLAYRALENQREMIELVKDKQNVNIVLNAGSGGHAPVPTFQLGK